MISANALAGIRHVALDMDGTIYRGDEKFSFTVPFLQTLDSLNIGYTFLTNNPSKSAAAYLTHLEKFGIVANETQFYSSAQATVEHIRNGFRSDSKLFLLGTPGLNDEFERSGITVVSTETPDIVVVSFDMTLNYERLCQAAWWISQGIPYLATNPDFICPTDQPTILVDCGAICECLFAATGRRPDVVLGKPDPAMLSGILNAHRIEPSQLAMVGDRLYTDIAMACAAKCLGVLVLSGEAKASDVQDSEFQPDFVYPTLKEFGEALVEAAI